MKILNLLCHSFVPSIAIQAKIAVDAGANEGGFSKWLNENTQAQIFAFEPDPRLFGKLPKLSRVEWIEKAIDGESGSFELRLGEATCSSAVYSESSSQSSVEVRKTSLDDFCNERGITEIDFIKIDIEGAELSLLEKTSDRLLRNTTQITVEFHDFLRAEDLPQIKAVVARLRSLGFYFVRFSFNTWGDCLLINQHRYPITFLDKLRINIFGKYIPGGMRLIKKAIR
jgi:FkbM family methyltransferase